MKRRLSSFIWSSLIVAVPWIVLLVVRIHSGALTTRWLLTALIGWVVVELLLIRSIRKILKEDKQNQELGERIRKYERDTANKILQQKENRHIELDARAEGQDMYQQWKEGNMILLPRPRRCAIMAYDEQTALSNEDYKRIRREEFERLKQQS